VITYFLNNSVKHWPILIMFGMQDFKDTPVENYVVQNEFKAYNIALVKVLCSIKFLNLPAARRAYVVLLVRGKKGSGFIGLGYGYKLYLTDA